MEFHVTTLPKKHRHFTRKWLCALLATGLSLLINSVSHATVTVGDAEISVAYYNDSSCLVTIDNIPRIGLTTVDVDIDDAGSRMLIHCDTEDSRRLTLLARGDGLNVNERVELLSRDEIDREATGVTCWLTGSGVHYKDDSVPRRYVIHGSVILRAVPATEGPGDLINGHRQAFGNLTGLLERLNEATTVLPQSDDQNDSDNSTNTSDDQNDSNSDTNTSEKTTG